MDKKQKGFLKAGAFPVAAAVVAIVVVLGVLNYFNVFNLKSMVSTPKTPQPTGVKQAKSQNPGSDNNAPDDATVKSAVPSYTASFTDKAGFINLLKSWGIFNLKDTVGNRINKATIILTDKVIPNFPMGKPGKGFIAGTRLTYYSKEVNLIVYVAPDELKNDTGLFEDETIKVFHAISNIAEKDALKEDTASTAFVNNMHSKNQTFIKLVAK